MLTPDLGQKQTVCVGYIMAELTRIEMTENVR